jgi:type II secretory pathway predicted ATPase ExeA
VRNRFHCYQILNSCFSVALNLLELGILNQSGFCVISGEIGAGKTTLVRELLNRLDERVRVGLISNTNSTFSDLLGWILAAYELESESNVAVSRYRRFTDFVIEQYASGKHTLLIIDEAQNLSLSALEQLRMLSNINSEKDLVLQIILIGQNELRTKLQQPELEQFAQRIAIDYHLEALDQEETAEYIRHRAIKSGGSQQLFDDAACRLVYQYSDGIPRLINRICDLSLVYGFTESKKIIDADLIEAVTEDQQIDQLTTTPAASSKSITLPEKLATTRKDASAPEPAPKTNRGKQTSTIEKSAELKPAEKNAVKKTVKPTGKETEVKLTHGTSATIYTAAEKASIEKTQAESIAIETSNVADILIEKSKADTAFAEQTDAENLTAEKEAAEKAATEKAAIEKARADTELAKKAAAETAAAKSAAREKALTAKQAAQKAAASRAAAEKALAEKEAADAIAIDKASLEKVALAELAVSIAATAQQDADRAAAARAAAQQEASEKEAAAITAARKAAEASALAEPAIRATQSRTTHRRTRTILAFSVISVVVAASTWLVTRLIDTGAIRNPAVAAGQSFADFAVTAQNCRKYLQLLNFSTICILIYYIACSRYFLHF